MYLKSHSGRAMNTQLPDGYATRCFNGHVHETQGCEGCHHRYHVVRQGRVEGGSLLPPDVKGPEACLLCHQARHATPVKGCPICGHRIGYSMISAFKAAQPVRDEIMGLKLQSWLLSWRAGLANFLVWIGGGSAAGQFEGAGRFQRFFGWVMMASAIPVAQWMIKRQIRKKERLLPKLGPSGEIVFGEGADDGKDSVLYRK